MESAKKVKKEKDAKKAKKRKSSNYDDDSEEEKPLVSLTKLFLILNICHEKLPFTVLKDQNNMHCAIEDFLRIVCSYCNTAINPYLDMHFL